jgi:hypothetical protein
MLVFTERVRACLCARVIAQEIPAYGSGSPGRHRQGGRIPGVARCSLRHRVSQSTDDRAFVRSFGSVCGLWCVVCGVWHR